MNTTANNTAAALFVLSFTTFPGIADTPANADKFTTHYSHDRRALFALLMSLQTSGTPLYHATIKTA
jgi:hypothetical protein